MKAKKDYKEYKNTIMWLLLVGVLIPFYPAITVSEGGGISFPDNMVIGVAIVLVAFFLFWKYMKVFQPVYSGYYLWLYAFNGSLGSFETIPDLFNIQNAMFWISTILLILVWEDEVRALIKGKKKR